MADAKPEESVENNQESDINLKLNEILHRLSALECKKTSEPLETGAAKSDSNGEELQHSQQHSNEQTTAAAAIELQREFWAVKDSLSKIQLDPSLKLNEVTLGISKKDKPVQKIVQKTSRYLETGLKLCQLALADQENQANDACKYIEQIYLVLQAGIQANQQEYQSLMVQGQFDDDTARVFRILQQNSNAFSKEAVDQLELAAKISTMNTSSQGNNNNSSRGRSNYRGGYRGGFRGRYNNNARFQHGNRGSDVYRSFTNNTMPPFHGHGAGAGATSED
jgi:hypothetical protein